jgi:hypothetical protein
MRCITSSIKYADFRIEHAGWLKKVSKIEQKARKNEHKCARFEQELTKMRAF